jgi:type VI secretion system protein ImpH
LTFSGIEYFLSCTNQHTENASNTEGDQFSLIPYCGILLTKCRSKHALEIMLTHYFEGIPIHIEEFVRRKKRLKEISTLGECIHLGKNTILGEEYIDSCGMFRIVIGPLKLVEYVNFTADSISIKLLKKIVNSFISDQLDYDIEVQLRMDGLIPVALGSCSTRLGETTLLGESADQEMIYSMIVK